MSFCVNDSENIRKNRHVNVSIVPQGKCKGVIMDMSDLFGAGSDIMDAVSKAVETGDYSGLSGSIQDRVKEAVSGTAEGEPEKKKKTSKKNYFLQRRPSRNLGMGRFAAGIALGILPGLSTIWLLFEAFVDLAGGWMYSFRTDVVSMLIFSLITFGCAMLARSGLRKTELIKRYYRYGEVIGTGREYVAMQELEDRTGISRDQIREDIEKLRAESILPYAVLDRSKTTLILSDRMYKEYLQAEKSRQAREEEERMQKLREEAMNPGTGESWEQASAKVEEQEAKARAAKAHQETEQTRSAGTAAQQKADANGRFSGRPAAGESGEAEDNRRNAASSLAAEGQAYIKEIRAINDRIPDTEEMSDKLYRLEDIMKRIFEQAKKDPAKEKDLRKLMNYYLPTTTKLLNAYADLNEQPEAGDNIRETKRQIEGSMDVINDAFEKLLDDLFETQAWDLSSDLNVMKNMMVQDGLTE